MLSDCLKWLSTPQTYTVAAIHVGSALQVSFEFRYPKLKTYAYDI